jgi:hypothetical protein
MKISVFWDMPFSSVSHRRFGGTYRLRLQGRRVSEERYKDLTCSLLLTGVLPAYSSTLKMEAMFLRNVVDFHRTTRKIFQNIGISIC